MSLLAELKRRNVLRVLIAYLAGAWLLIQIADVLWPIYGLSESSLQVLTNLLGIGLIPAIIVSWAFEWLNKVDNDGRGLYRYAQWDPFLKNLRQDPRWPDYLARNGVNLEELASVEFNIFDD